MRLCNRAIFPLEFEHEFCIPGDIQPDFAGTFAAIFLATGTLCAHRYTPLGFVAMGILFSLSLRTSALIPARNRRWG